MLVNDLVGVDVGPTNLSLASLIETARVSGLAGRVRSARAFTYLFRAPWAHSGNGRMPALSFHSCIAGAMLCHGA